MNRDEVMATLRQWEAEARAGSDDTDENDRELAAAFDIIAPLVLEAADDGDTWGAVVNALLAGRIVGMWSSGILIRNARLTGKVGALMDTYPDAQAGRKHRAGGRKGAAIVKAKSGLTDAMIDRAMRHIHASDPGMYWSSAADIVARDWGRLHPHGSITGRQVRRRTSVKW
jgi:hypothetical protein